MHAEGPSSLRAKKTRFHLPGCLSCSQFDRGPIRLGVFRTHIVAEGSGANFAETVRARMAARDICRQNESWNPSRCFYRDRVLHPGLDSED